MLSSSSSFPHRNIDRLYCPAITYLCAIGAKTNNNQQQQHNTEAEGHRPCIPCAYKICNFDIALDHEFTTIVPNQRPEQCPRSNDYLNRTPDTCVDGMMGYRRRMNVLTVGDGDFSFSLAVAQLIDSGMVVATSYEDLPTLKSVYPDFEDTLNSLKRCANNVVVGYNVDATQLRKTLPHNVIQSNVKFHRICWNFPCTAIGRGQDGQNDAMEENKELVRKFIVNSLEFLNYSEGEIHIAHKTKPPFNQWGLEMVALEGIHKSGIIEDFEYKGRIVLDKCALPPYTPRKALDRKSFPCHDAVVFVFGRSVGKSTIPDDDDVVNHLDVKKQQLTPSAVIPVTAKLIENVRSVHIKLPGDESKKRPSIVSSKSKKGKKQRRK